jgi:creatinine amidohydrolase
MEKSVEAAKGTTGSPSRSSGEKGKEYHEHLVERLVEVIKNIQEA